MHESDHSYRTSHRCKTEARSSKATSPKGEPRSDEDTALLVTNFGRYV